MAALVCDICGGRLVAKAGGLFECEYCGMQYDKTRVQEMVQEIKGTVKVEGTVEVKGTVKLDGPVKVEGTVTKENLVKRAKMKLENAQIRPNSGWFLGKSPEYYEIKDLLEQALVMDPEYAEAHLYMALLNRSARDIATFRTRYVEDQCPCDSFQQFCRFATGELAALAEEIQRDYDAEGIRRVKQKEEEERQRQLEQERKIRLEQEAKQRAEEEKRIAIQRLTEVRARIAPVQKRIDKYIGTVAMNVDGTAVAYDSSLHGTWDVSHIQSWRDLVAVSAGYNHCVGLCADGTVVATKITREGLRTANYYREDQVKDWADIVEVSAGNSHTVGLKKDGTVLAAGCNDNGECNVTDWRNIVAVSAGYGHTVGLKKGGKAVATGWNGHKQCDVRNWSDLVAVSAGYEHTVGLKKDGTVVAAGRNDNGECNVTDWKEIVAVSAGQHFTVGLKADGTVVAVGNNNGSTKNWKNVVAVAGFVYPVGITEEGWVLTFDKKDSPVHGWRVFNHIDTLAQDKIDALEAQKEALEAELSQLKGIFSGKRRKEIETRLAEIETELKGR